MSRRARVAPTILAAALLVTACGTRVAEKERAAEASHAVPEPGSGDPVLRPEPPPAAGAPTDLRRSKPGRISAPGQTPPALPAERVQSQLPKGAASEQTTPTAPRPVPSTTAPPAPVAGPRSPILLASVGTYAGPAGSILLPILQGAQVWVRAVNAKGGVNGHEIKLLVYDDGGDTARHRSQVQEAVERRGVIAFFVNAEAVTGAGSVSYLESKRIPVIGISLGELWAYGSPMYFPQASAAEELLKAVPLSVAHQVIPRGKKRVGTVVCAEFDVCAKAERIFSETAEKAGLRHVYSGRASLAQPDYTAECLAARNQDVEVLVVALDQYSLNRFTAACARQAYHPIYASNLIIDEHKDNPELAGAVSETIVFPWFQSGTPGTDEFHAAVRAYGGGLKLGVFTAAGWTAGKLLELAAAHISEPPRTEDLLEGLWAIKGDTLGGLTAPLTFVKNERPPRVTCWFDLTIDQRAWVSPDGFQLHCV